MQIACREIRSHMRRFIIPIDGRRTFSSGLIFCWMNNINKTISNSGLQMLKIRLFVAAPFTAVQSSLILTSFARPLQNGRVDALGRRVMPLIIFECSLKNAILLLTGYYKSDIGQDKGQKASIVL